MVNNEPLPNPWGQPAAAPASAAAPGPSLPPGAVAAPTYAVPIGGPGIRPATGYPAGYMSAFGYSQHDSAPGGPTAYIEVCGERMPAHELQPWHYPMMCCCPCCIGNPCSSSRKAYYLQILKSFIGVVSVIQVVLFIVSWALGATDMRNNPMFGPSTASLLTLGANYYPLETRPNYQIWRVFTCIFLHAGLFHIFFNLMAQIIFGRQCEPQWGHYRTGAVYIISGLMGSIFSAVMRPASLGVGASGALLGIAGCMLAKAFIDYMRPGGQFDPNARQTLIQLLMFIAITFFLGMGSGTVDNAAHFGGLLGGVLMGAVLFGNEISFGPTYLPRLARACAAGILVGGIAGGLVLILTGW
eukprot:tig00000254_g22540.t1